MAVEVCAYCGETKPLTADHVPPKLMLEEPYPDNLVTVREPLPRDSQV